LAAEILISAAKKLVWKVETIMYALEASVSGPATDRFHAGIDCVVHDFVSTKAKCYQRYRDISPIFPILRAILEIASLFF